VKLRIESNDESKTSVATLAATLTRIDGLADPDKVKVIAVHLDGLWEPER
jgi:hypothetical protein